MKEKTEIITTKKSHENLYLFGLLSDVLSEKKVETRRCAILNDLKDICNNYHKEIAQKMILGILSWNARPEIPHNELVKVSYKIWNFYKHIREGSDIKKLISIGG